MSEVTPVTPPIEIEILWRDSYDMQPTWSELGEVLHTVEKTEYVIKTRAYLIGENKKYLVVAAHVAARGDTYLVAGVMVIPRASVMNQAGN